MQNFEKMDASPGFLPQGLVAKSTYGGSGVFTDGQPPFTYAGHEMAFLP
jgi:hypothetical protein